MGVVEELAKISPEKDTVLTIGVFDGVHLGHKYLLSKLKEQARQQSLLTGVVTFRRHPQELLFPQTRLPYLADLAERTRLLKDEGIDIVVALSFTPELAHLSAREFIELLKKYLRIRGLVVGPDFALGRDREGDVNFLRALGQEVGFSVTVIPPIMINGEVVSSTAIRHALANGDVKRVCQLTGRFFSLHGRVVSGVGRGTGLGFPTANLDIGPQQALPADGVYATRAYINGKDYPSVANIGKRPTFSGTDRTVEVYLFDYQADLYGHDLKIDIVERLRSEQRFSTAVELEKQIKKDVAQARAILESCK